MLQSLGLTINVVSQICIPTNLKMIVGSGHACGYISLYEVSSILKYFGHCHRLLLRPHLMLLKI